MSDVPLGEEELRAFIESTGGLIGGGLGTVGSGEVAPAPTAAEVQAARPTEPTDKPDDKPDDKPGGKKVTNVVEFVRNGRKIKRTTYSDGTFDEEDLGEADKSGTGDDDRADSDAAFRAQQRSDAFSRIKTLLARFGLSDLESAVNNIITSGAVDLGDPNAIIFAIRGEDAYKRRFAGNAARAKKGLPELDPSSYIGLEESYRQLMQANGLPAGFYDQTSDFQRLIEGDVSPSELQDRVEQGYRRVQDADPEVKRQMRELYNVDDNALVAYFLDPDKATPLLTRQARAAQIAARGKEQAGLQLTAASAEDLAARGITPEEAQQAFAQRAQLEGLYQPLTGEEALTEQEALGATFGYNVQAQQALERRRRQRVGEFQAGGGFTRTSGVTSGTVETGLGGPQ